MNKDRAKQECKRILRQKLKLIEITGRTTTETLEWEDGDWCVKVFIGLEPNNPILGKFLDNEVKINRIKYLESYKTIRYEVCYKNNEGFRFTVKYDYESEVYEYKKEIHDYRKPKDIEEILDNAATNE